jgi:hypothetical protein
MKKRYGLLALVLLVAAPVMAQQPTIGVYFDAAGTQTSTVAPYGPMHTVTAYIMATHTEQTVGGAAFKLDLDPKIMLVGASYPPGIQVGALTEGIQIGLTNCYFGYYDNPVLLATLTLNTGTNIMTEAPLSISAYPPAGEVQLADCNAAITTVAGGTALLTVYPPTVIGVYWDQAGTQTNKTANGGYDETQTAYIIAMDTEQTVGGAAFKLSLDPMITLTGATFPPGLQVGTLLDGIQIGLTDCYFGFYGNPVLLSTLTLWTGANLIPNGIIQILPYPPAGAIQLADCNAAIRNVDGGTATLTIAVPTENKSWGEIKSLYSR